MLYRWWRDKERVQQVSLASENSLKEMTWYKPVFIHNNDITLFKMSCIVQLPLNIYLIQRGQITKVTFHIIVYIDERKILCRICFLYVSNCLEQFQVLNIKNKEKTNLSLNYKYFLRLWIFFLKIRMFISSVSNSLCHKYSNHLGLFHRFKLIQVPCDKRVHIYCTADFVHTSFYTAAALP